jgi:opacity protein-like surface antigen
MKALRLAATLAAALGSTTAAAQDAWNNDVFAGYSMLAVGEKTFHGWHAALGWGLSGRLDLVLDVSGHSGRSLFGDDVDVLSVMAGPRFVFGSGRFRPFVHVIGGLVRSTQGIPIFEVDITESATDLGGAAGGGVDIGFGDRWALRIAGDYRAVKTDAETLTDPRFSAGVVYGFGAK